MNHQELNELLGAYAVDALDEREANLVEVHLASCVSCRAELDGLQAVAGMLGTDIAAPPDAIWQRIESRIDRSSSDVDAQVRAFPLQSKTAKGGSPIRHKLLAVAAAVLLFVAVGGILLQRDDGGSSASELAQAAVRAATVPGSQQFKLRSADGAHSADAVMLPSGNGYVTNVNLPKLPEGKTYQLWMMRGSTPVSAGLLGRDPTTVAFAAPDGAAGMAISEEPEAGSIAPTAVPVVSTTTV